MFSWYRLDGWERAVKCFVDSNGGLLFPCVEDAAFEKKLRCEPLAGGGKVVGTRVVGLLRPVHIGPLCGVLHVVCEGIANVAGNIDGLYFESPKVINAPLFVISTEDDINVSGGATIGVFEANFGERCPVCACREKEVRRVVGDEPILAKAHRASNGDFSTVNNAANAERVLRFVFGAVGDFVVEGAKPLGAVTRGGRITGRWRKAKNFCEWVLLRFRVRHG